jgi:GNAT superfamily N-acetyltransferase
VNARALTEHVTVAKQLFPDCGATAMPVAGGVASFVGADIPVSYAVGLGLQGPVTEAEIAQVAEFYCARGAVPRVDVCALADKSLLEALRVHHFQLHSFVNVLAQDLTKTDEPPAVPQEIRIRRAAANEADLWTRIVDGGFGDGAPLTENHRRMCMIFFHLPRSRTYLAEIDGQPVGGGLLSEYDGYAALAAASVLPDFRRLGVHAALIRTRLQDARELGCDIAGYFCEPGSASQRNAERHGFRLMYTKAVMKQARTA